MLQSCFRLLHLFIFFFFEVYPTVCEYDTLFGHIFVHPSTCCESIQISMGIMSVSEVELRFSWEIFSLVMSLWHTLGWLYVILWTQTDGNGLKKRYFCWWQNSNYWTEMPTRESLSSTSVVLEQFKGFGHIIVILEIRRDFIVQVVEGRCQYVTIGGWLRSAKKPKPGISHESWSLSLDDLYQPKLSKEGFIRHIFSAGSWRKKYWSSSLVYDEPPE